MKRCNKCEEYDDPTTHKCSVRKIKPVATTDDALRELEQIVTNALLPIVTRLVELSQLTGEPFELGNPKSVILAAARAYGEQCRVDEINAIAGWRDREVMFIAPEFRHLTSAEQVQTRWISASERLAALTSKREEQA